MSISLVVALHRGCYYGCSPHLYLVCEDKKLVVPLMEVNNAARIQTLNTL